MKLLKQYTSLFDAEKLVEKLEKKGIATHLSSKRSHTLSSHRTGAIKVGVWIILDHQYQDANEYLHNLKHQVTTGISAEDMSVLKQQSKISIHNSLNKFLIYAFSIISILALIIYFVVVSKT